MVTWSMWDAPSDRDYYGPSQDEIDEREGERFREWIESAYWPEDGPVALMEMIEIQKGETQL